MARKGIMLATKINDRLLSNLPSEIYVQPKLNGRRCRAFISPLKVTLLSSEANEITSVPHITRELQDIAEKLRAMLVLDGELYSHGMAVQDIAAIVGRRANLHPDHLKMEYHVYDLIPPEVYLTLSPQAARVSQLENFIHDTVTTRNYVKHVCTKLRPKRDWQNIEAEYVRSGYEGIIMRHPEGLYETKKSKFLLKHKPLKEEIFEIVSFHEEIDIYGNPKYQLGSLTLKTKDGKLFHCGSGKLNHEERREHWGKFLVVSGVPYAHARVQYPELTKRSIPSQPILQELI